MRYLIDLFNDLRGAVLFGYRLARDDFQHHRHLRRGGNPDEVPF